MKKALFSAIALTLATSVFADAKTDALTKQLTTALPGLKIDAIIPSLVPGVYQITSGQEIAYVSADGKYMFQGILFDVDKRKNLSEEAKNGPRATILKELKSPMIVSFPAKGKKVDTVTVFTDPSCPYCRKLHEEVPKMTELGIEVHYVTFPREGLNSEIGKAIEKAFCSDDVKASIDKLMQGDSLASAKECTNGKGKEALNLFGTVANQIGAHGTPFIVSTSGRAIPGYRPAAEVLKALQ